MEFSDTNLSVLFELDNLCEEFERTYRHGLSPSIADFLDRVNSAHRGKLLRDLVELEVGLQVESGTQPKVEELLDRYAGLLLPGEHVETIRAAIEHALASTHASDGSTVSFVPSDPNQTVTFVRSTKLAREATLPRIPGYKTHSILGKGGMSIVYKATQTAIDRTVAIKMILNREQPTRELFERFKREAKAIASLNDERFVKIHEFGDHDGNPYMTLEFVSGGSLEEFRRREQQPERFCAEIVEQIALAMHKAHQANLLHRDLKPHNILMTPDGKPKIADFGLVKRQDRDESLMTEYGRVMGTASYMSPEQSRGDQVDAAMDIYAMGGILYCLLTGRPPFLGSTPTDTILQVRHDEPIAPSRLRPGMSKDLESVCMKCLEKIPKKRYGSSLDLAQDLRNFMENRPTKARPIGRLDRGWRWVRRNKLLSTVAGLVALIAVGSSLMSWKLSDTNQRLIVERNTAETERNNASTARENAEAARLAKSQQYDEILAGYHDVLYRADNLLRDNQRDVKVRKKLIEISMESLQRVQDFDEKNTLYDRDEAIGRQRLGDILMVTGELEQASAAYDAAYQAIHRAMLQEPLEPKHYRNLANACEKQAAVSRRLGGTLRAREKYQEALQLRLDWEEKQRVVSGLEHIPALKAIAESHRQLGEIELSLGDANLALKQFSASQEWYRKLPREEQFQELAKLSDLEHWLGETHIQLGNAAEAENFLTRAESKRKNLFTKDTGSATNLFALARARLKLGDFFLMSQGDPSKAWSWYKQAHKDFTTLLADEPDSAQRRGEMANIEYRIGALLQRAAKSKITLEAVPDGNDPQTHFQRSCELREALAKIDDDDMQAKIEWSLALARCGRALEAETLAANLVQRGQNNPRLLFQAACALALCSEATDKLLADRCRQRAYEALELAIKSGWKDRVQLRDDPDLDPIRSEPKFLELLKTIP